MNELAIQNINTLLPFLKSRLSSSGKNKTKDSSGNEVYVDCEIYSNDVLSHFLQLSLMEFNQTPLFTFFTFEDTKIISLFGEILVEGATLYALASKALIERGREFEITDNGVNFSPPTVSELLMTQYHALMGHHYDKLKLIKLQIGELKIED